MRNIKEIKHYDTVKYCGDTYKIGDKVFVLNHYDIEERIITDIFDDYYDDESGYICKCVYTKSLYSENKTFDHLEDIFLDRSSAKYKIEQKKRAYDHWALSRY